MFYKSRFSIEDWFGPFEGWTTGQRWNGWECPSFEFGTAIRIVDTWNKVAFGEEKYQARYDEERDEFCFSDGGLEEWDCFRAQTTEIEGRSVKEAQSRGMSQRLNYSCIEKVIRSHLKRAGTMAEFEGLPTSPEKVPAVPRPQSELPGAERLQKHTVQMRRAVSPPPTQEQQQQREGAPQKEFTPEQKQLIAMGAIIIAAILIGDSSGDSCRDVRCYG